ncbi:MAG: PKD domain-containing protein [Nitrospiraceae bacterium]|nr:MAG: PKD domain-containing protein [Nitrospiraceae bacterium]
MLCSFFSLVVFYHPLQRSACAVSETIQYRYDNARQITGVTYDDGTVVEYTYDRSGNRVFKTITAGTALNTPPYEAWGPSIPEGGEGVSTLPSLSWKGGDPDTGDEVIFFLSFGECGSESQVYSGRLEHYSPGRLNSFAGYCWQVMTRDNHNAETSGQLWTFTTANDAPEPAELTAPQDGETLYTSSTMLSWSGSDPNPDDRLTYDIHFGTTVAPPLVQGGHAGTTYLAGGLNSGMTYYWKIAARDDHHAVTEGPLWSFTVDQLVPGMTIDGYHENNSDEDYYPMTFSSGDVIKVRAGFHAYGADPQIRIYNTDGSLLCGNHRTNYKWHRHAAEIDGCLIPDDGTYTLILSEYGADETGGAYSLSVQRLNNGSGDMSYGESIADRLTGTAGLNIHTFSAGENDAVMVRMGFDVSGGDPQIRIYGPEGTKLNPASCSSSVMNDDTTQYPAETAICMIPLTGIYTIVASEMDGDEEGGGYHLVVDKLNNDLSSLSYGQTVTGVLDSTADSDLHTFTAAAGDSVMARLGFTANGIDPLIRIFSPDGTNIACQALMSNHLYGNGRYAAEINGCILPEDGIYAIIVSNNAGDGQGGGYHLKLDRLNKSSATVSFGQTVSGELSVAPDFEVHTFWANANDRIIVRMGFVASGPDPQISLYGPSGNWMSCGLASYRLNNGHSAETAICILPEEGTYTVVASEFYGDESGGPYTLSIQRVNNIYISSNYKDNVQDMLEASTAMDVHTFAGSAGDRVMIRMGFTVSGADPQVRLYDPLGQAMPCQSFRTNFTNNFAAEITSCPLPADGTYSILLSEYEGNETGGAYNLSMERLNNTSADIAYGQSVPGTLAATADSDALTFMARDNDTISVTMGFTSMGPDPQIRLFSSSGDTVLCQNYRNNTSTNDPAAVSNCVIPADGPYTIIASEHNGNETGGGYTLTLKCRSGTCNIPPVADAGGPYSGVEGQVVSLDGSGSQDPDGTITLYEWDVDSDGIFEYNSTLPGQGHTCSQQGTYVLKLRVVDDTGAAAESTTEVSIADTAPAADFTVEPSVGPAPLTVRVVNNSTGYDQPLLCEWDFDSDGTVDSFEYTPAFRFNNTGSYTVKLKVTDSDGSSDTLIKTDCVTVTLAGCSTLPVKTDGALPLYFSAIQSAYDSARDGESILVRAADFTENLVFDRSVSLTLKGGYDCEYQVSDGTTTVNGDVLIRKGVLIISEGTLQVK